MVTAGGFISSSLLEGFGLVMLGTMAAGLPVIASRNTGGPDVIEEGKEGFIVPAGSVVALREKMEWCERNLEKVAEMGIAAHQKVIGFTWEKHSEGYAKIVSEVVLNKK